MQSPLGMCSESGRPVAYAEPQTDCEFPLPVFYVNRDCDDDRRARIELELKGAGLAGERVPAVNGLAVPEDLRSYFFEADTPDSRLKLGEDSRLKPGEVGCYASHLKTFKIIVERSLKYALVVEDDALLPRDIRGSIEEIIASLPDTWDFVHLGGDTRRAIKPLCALEHGRTLVRFSRVPSGTFGYLISAAGARKLLTPVRRHWPFDTDTRRPWLFGVEVFGVVPRIITHNDAPPSCIQTTGGRARGRRGVQTPSRASWTGNPLHSPEAAYYNFKTLGPLWWGSCLLRNAFARFTRGLGLQGKPAGSEPLAPLNPASPLQ